MEKVLQAAWFKLIDGLPPGPKENPKALRTATPSNGVVKRIGESVRFRKRNRRLFWASIISLLLILLLVGLGGSAAVYATIKINEAAAALAKAEGAKLETEKQRRLAMNFKDEAYKQSIEAGRQCHEANKQAWLAEGADAQREIAEARKREADRDASRQRTIASATEYGNRSDAAFKQKPELLPKSLSYAVTSAKLLESIGQHSLFTDISLRNSLGLFAKPLPTPPVSHGDLLSPDANFVARKKNDQIEVGPVGRPQEMKTTPDKGQILAVSSGGNYLATATEDGAYGDVSTTVLVRELNTRRTFSVKLTKKNVRIISASLSFGGKYLALVLFETWQEEELYYAGVWNVERGKFITPLVTPADIVQLLSYGESTVTTVAFSPDNRAIAIGGTKVERRGFDMGYVRVWDLGVSLLLNDELLDTPLGDQDPIKADFFHSYVDLYQDDPVRAVAVGKAGDYLAATSRQMTRVLKKDSRGNYQEAGRFLQKNLIDAIAFGPAANTLSGVGNGVLYSWEATGYHEMVQNPSASELLQSKLAPDNSATSSKTASETDRIALTPQQMAEDDEIVANETGGGVLIINNPRHVVFIHRGGTLRIWDKIKRKEARVSLQEEFGPALTIDTSFDGSYIALNGYNRDLNRYVTAVYQLGSKGYSRVQRWVEPYGRPNALKLNPEGTLLSLLYGEEGSAIQLRSTRNGGNVLPRKMLSAFSGNKIALARVADTWSPQAHPSLAQNPMALRSGRSRPASVAGN